MSESGLINIGGSPHDKSYRYKRNRIEIKTIKFNGVQTCVTNMYKITTINTEWKWCKINEENF